MVGAVCLTVGVRGAEEQGGKARVIHVALDESGTSA